ncbi:MAG: hypothetical protein ACE5R3_07145 [Nitrosopumilaceae archaeon]
MQEIALFLSSIAGACTAAAVKKFPKNKVESRTIGSNSQIKSQINSLRLEKEILTKTITRLYQNDVGLNKIQRDKLLLRYQHQLGIILAKIEKLEIASKHPDLGPVGEGLITLMDQKLSHLDKRLYELSSKITIANSQTPEIKTEVTTQKEDSKKEKPIVKVQEKPVVEKRIEEKPQPKVIIPTIQATPQVPTSVELTTLTDVSKKHPEFPFIEQKPLHPITETVKEIVKQEVKAPEKVESVQTPLKTEVKPEAPKQEIQTRLPESQQEITQNEEEKPQASLKIPDEEKIDDDEDDLDKIKGEIMKTLSRLEQAEVE